MAICIHAHSSLTIIHSNNTECNLLIKKKKEIAKGYSPELNAATAKAYQFKGSAQI